MLVSTGLLVRSAMAAGLVADAPTGTLRTGWLARERERARSTGNGLTYLARDTNVRICRIEGVTSSYTYAMASVAANTEGRDRVQGGSALRGHQSGTDRRPRRHLDQQGRTVARYASTGISGRIRTLHAQQNDPL